MECSLFYAVSCSTRHFYAGVFGAGKSYLLSVIVKFIVSVMEVVDSDDDSASVHCTQSKVLISSMTNVAVDRILLRYFQAHMF